MKSPNEVIEMVQACSTEELEKLIEVEPNNFYGIMVSLAVKHEYDRRQNNSSKQSKKEEVN